MSEFEREDRYAVIKYKKLTDQQWTLVPTMLEKLDGARVDCVVVEKHWPEYNFVWLMLEHRMAGYPVPDFNAVKCAADVAVAQAELETAKATIAMLSADKETMRNKNNELNDTVTHLQSEIERLKGGQGEPQVMGRVYTDDGITKCELNSIGRALPDHTPLYAPQPAPVSAATYDDGFADGLAEASLYMSAPVSPLLPNLMEMRPFQTVDRGSTNYKAGFNACIKQTEELNACIDKVKELNQ